MDNIDKDLKGTFVSKPRAEATSQAQPPQRGGTFDFMDKASEAALDIWNSYGTKKGRESSSLKGSVENAIIELVKKEGGALVEEVPFANAILVTIKLSIAFSNGIGTAIDEVNSQLTRKYDRDIREFLSHQAEVSDKDVETLKFITCYMANNVKELDGILLKGVSSAFEEGIKLLLEAADDRVKDIFKDVATQLAKNLIETNEFIALLAEATRKAAGSIPAGRRKVEAKAFYFVSNAFLAQWNERKFANSLKKTLGGIAKSDESIDVAILASIIKTLTDDAYTTYLQESISWEEANNVQRSLLEIANDLVNRLKNQGFHLEESSTLEVKPDHIGLPRRWKIAIEERGKGSVEEDLRYYSRREQFENYVKGLQTVLDIKGRRYQQIVNHVFNKYNCGRIDNEYTSHCDDVLDAYQKLAQADYDRAKPKVQKARQCIIREFGKKFGGIIERDVDKDTHYMELKCVIPIDPRLPPD